MADATSDTIQKGLKQINLSGKVARGFNCVIKAIIKGRAKIVFLADDIQEKDYKELITNLCKKYDVHLEGGVKKEELGGILGLDSVKSDGTVRRKISCGTCAITGYGPHVPATEEFLAAFAPEELGEKEHE